MQSLFATLALIVVALTLSAEAARPVVKLGDPVTGQLDGKHRSMYYIVTLGTQSVPLHVDFNYTTSGTEELCVSAYTRAEGASICLGKRTGKGSYAMNLKASSEQGSVSLWCANGCSSNQVIKFTFKTSGNKTATTTFS